MINQNGERLPKTLYVQKPILTTCLCILGELLGGVAQPVRVDPATMAEQESMLRNQNDRINGKDAHGYILISFHYIMYVYVHICDNSN